MPIKRPTWLPSYLPELQGLRGLAVLAVVAYHCHPRLEGTRIHYASLWGWAGVNLFFVLSGFLITSILLEAQGKPRYFRNFYGRRALRIWPVYVLVLAACYWHLRWLASHGMMDATKGAPWPAYVFFVQNLFYPLSDAIGPTWSLAIEEQYYFLWAPLVRFLRRPWMLAAVLTGPLAAAAPCEPALGHAHPHAHSPGRDRPGQSAGAGALHAPAQPPPVALDRPGRAGAGHCRRGPRGRRNVVPRFRIGGGVCRRGAGRDCLNRRPQSHQRGAQPRAAGLLWPHQLRPLHDPHPGLHLVWLVRPGDGPLWNGRQPHGSGSSPGRLHRAGHRAVVRLRVADPQTQALFLGSLRPDPFSHRGQRPTIANKASRKSVTAGAAGSWRRR